MVVEVGVEIVVLPPTNGGVVPTPLHVVVADVLVGSLPSAVVVAVWEERVVSEELGTVECIFVEVEDTEDVRCELEDGIVVVTVVVAIVLVVVVSFTVGAGVVNGSVVDKSTDDVVDPFAVLCPEGVLGVVELEVMLLAPTA